MTMTEHAEIVGADPYVTPSERDRAILEDRAAQLAEISTPKVGDFVRFTDDVIRRISHVWSSVGEPVAEWSIQTSNGGSYYLGAGYVSMSGGLFPGIPGSLFQPTDETASGEVWFFHHDLYRAHSAVIARIPFRVWSVPMGANR